MARFTTIAARAGTRRVAAGIAAVVVAGAGAGSFLAVHAATSGPAPAAQLATATAATGPASPAAPAHRARGRRPLLAAIVRATVKETGLSAQTVRQDLQAGQTIDQIAGAKASAVENDVISAITARLDRARSKGRITQQQETNLLARARTRIEKLMSTPLKSHAAAGAAA